jgi:hypothetical protein
MKTTNISKFNTLINRGLEILTSEDRHLLDNNLSERCITHKLGEHYQNIFPDWNVDCEYNRNLKEIKEWPTPEEMLEMFSNILRENNNIFSEFNIINEKLSITVSKEEIDNLITQLRDRKNIKEYPELDLYLFQYKMLNGEKIMKRIFPDIIVHERGVKII